MDQQKSLDITYLNQWMGREEVAVDLLEIGLLNRIGAFFELPSAFSRGDPIPETWHWCFFHVPRAQAELGHDGHPRTGGFLPPFELPRRMWGGSRLHFHRPLVAGEAAEKISRIASVDLKRGKSGTLGLVTVEHRITQGGNLCRTEEQDIIYREAATAANAALTLVDCPDGSENTREVAPDPVMLFRYSALTYNAHRIHYDRSYAQSEEGYAGLVVHGQLTASFLADFARQLRNGAPLQSFSFRGTSPLFDGEVFHLHAKAEPDALRLWAQRPDGGMAMAAKAKF